MRNQIKCDNCKSEYKISYCLMKSLSNRKVKFALPCGHVIVRGNISFVELLKLFFR